MFPATFLRKEIISCNDARLLARRRLPWMVFDYIDGAAGEGYGERMNRENLQKIHLQPRVQPLLRQLGPAILRRGHDHAPPPRARSHYHFAPPLIHFIPDC